MSRYETDITFTVTVKVRGRKSQKDIDTLLLMDSADRITQYLKTTNGTDIKDVCNFVIGETRDNGQSPEQKRHTLLREYLKDAISKEEKLKIDVTGVRRPIGVYRADPGTWVKSRPDGPGWLQLASVEYNDAKNGIVIRPYRVDEVRDRTTEPMHDQVTPTQMSKEIDLSDPDLSTRLADIFRLLPLITHIPSQDMSKAYFEA